MYTYRVYYNEKIFHPATKAAARLNFSSVLKRKKSQHVAGFLYRLDWFSLLRAVIISEKRDRDVSEDEDNANYGFLSARSKVSGRHFSSRMRKSFKNFG